ncbi:hypothetical protein CLU79DRAFT_771134 [Phycomyces nitens]|nr:hypothetical protein CLU79DRAFT_771134 [Phycomyces nitens]
MLNLLLVKIQQATQTNLSRLLLLLCLFILLLLLLRLLLFLNVLLILKGIFLWKQLRTMMCPQTCPLFLLLKIILFLMMTKAPPFLNLMMRFLFTRKLLICLMLLVKL